MRALLNRRPSPALVISIVALFMATSGGAVAAVSASQNTSASSAELWAVISSSGHILSGRGVTSAKQLPGTGSYQVLFNRNVSKCSAVASAHYPSGFVEVEPRNGHKNGEYVYIWDRTNTAANEEFDIQVEC